jgi:hypothetical protein
MDFAHVLDPTTKINIKPVKARRRPSKGRISFVAEHIDQ